MSSQSSGLMVRFELEPFHSRQRQILLLKRDKALKQGEDVTSDTK
jgi:hypothetical protein